jgi:NAD-dependent SIR2 family protein deacetylase
MNKTVYILGAGFSKEALAPSQEELVSKIFEIHSQYPYEFTNGSVDKFKVFLKDTLLIPETLHNKIPLEDIFTPLDRCLADNISFRNLDIDQIKEIRGLIYYLIGKTLENLLRNSEKTYIDNFAKHLVEKASKRLNHNYREVDNVSILSTNWDILLDNSLKQNIDNNYYKKAVVDYCCYISSYWENDESVKPGLEVLGQGGFNVKLLKLHGSLNWLQCPRCLRVYVDFHNKIAIGQYTDPVNCRHCDKHFGIQNSHKLSSNLIMPTFLKNLSNPQYKLIWQNAGIELSEAKRIVFIGYSLPQADFEMRQLLSRMVRPNAKIEVVDYGEETQARILDTMNRYNVFFGDRKPRFFLKGAKHYLENNLT